MSNQKVKAIIWDLDGTLIDSDLYIVANYLHMYELFRPGYYPHLREILGFSGPSVVDTLKKQFPDIPLEKTLKEFVHFSLNKEPSYLTLYKNEEEVILALNKAGIKQCVLTNKKGPSALNCLKHFPSIYHCMNFILSLDDVQKPKPDPEGVYKCVEKFNVSPKETMIIGDSSTDIVSGARAGILSGLVTWSLKGLPKEHRDYNFDTFDEIKEFVINGKLSAKDSNR